ncbi:MAG: aspartate/glutamate racemase family protein [Actinomycetota bacterium]
MTTFDIGILTGSGPEAGIDLWNAVLAERRARLGERYRGDLDAPSVLVRSEPRLGLSMDIELHRDAVVEAAMDHAPVLDADCSAWAIACNTIHLIAPDLSATGVDRRLVSYVDVVERWLAAQPAGSVALAAVRPVAQLGSSSAYQRLADRVVRLPDDVIEDTHQLVDDVKRTGPTDPLRDRWRALRTRMPAESVLLACTELPLVAAPDDPSTVDVTRLVAAALLDAATS